MAKSTAGRIVIDDLTGGRNPIDNPWEIGENECVDAVNVDWYRTRFARKRGGSEAVSLTFSAGGPFTGAIGSLFRHVPGTEDTAAELWAIDSAGVWGRMAAAATFAAPTLKDANTGQAFDIAEASINGKLALAYESAVARMHGWDGSTVRRLGLAASAAPTAADGGGGGAYAAVLRYYRQRSTVQSGGITIRRSEPSASVSFTPSGANANATVTQATVINEGETHWEVEASIDNVTFYRIATVAIATTTYADTAATTSYNTNPLSAATGTYTVWPSVRFIKADQNRLIGFGDHTAANKQSRLYFSAVIGSLDVGDEERLDTTTNYYIDLDEADSGGAIGLAGPILGSFFAFKFRQVWRLTATGQVSQPFRADPISKVLGAVHHRSIAIGEDADGNPCLYWWSHRGPYRWGVNGLEYIGKGVEDYAVLTEVNGSKGSGNPPACHTLFYQAKRQVWFFVRYDDAGVSRQTFVYHTESGGWSRYDWDALASVVFANTLGATMSTDWRPYFSIDTNPGIKRTDIAAATDSGVGFKATITTKVYEPGGPGFYSQVGDAMLLARKGTSVPISVSVMGDFETSVAATNAKVTTVDISTPSGNNVIVDKRVEDSTLGGFKFYQYTVGDAAATTAAWSLGRLVIPFERTEQASS